MKRLLALLFCCAALPLAAQRNSYEMPERIIPQPLYQALLNYPELKQQQRERAATGEALGADESRILLDYEQTLKGLIVVEAGYPSCAPCNRLLTRLEKADGPDSSLLEQWRAAGVRFYQLDWLKDRQTRDGKNISALWKINAVPVLLFFKDGKEVARLNGFPSDPSAADKTVAEIKETALRHGSR